MPTEQPGILTPLPPFSRQLFFNIHVPELAQDYLFKLREYLDLEHTVVGCGASLASALGKKINGLTYFPALSGPGIDIPSTQTALWFWLQGEDPGVLFHRSRALEDLLSPAFSAIQNVDLFKYGNGLDLTGYEDGTENPSGDDARQAAFVTDPDDPLVGSSFVAIQQWLHDFDAFEAMGSSNQDDIIGRRRVDNIELEHAPMSAHVKRSAQESFSPSAFMLRRSMPWTQGNEGGLMFVAFGQSFQAFNAVLHRMVGLEDGIVDALFSFSEPLNGAYFWCPPLEQGRLDLRALGL